MLTHFNNSNNNNNNNNNPQEMGSEFITEFQSGSLGLELEEIRQEDDGSCYIKVKTIIPGGQAEIDKRINENCIVVGVENLPIQDFVDFQEYMGVATMANEGIVHLHFLDMKLSDSVNQRRQQAEAEGEEKKLELDVDVEVEEDFFVTGGGHLEKDELVADRTKGLDKIEPPMTGMTEATQMPSIPKLPLKLSASLEDEMQVTIYFQNKHATMGMRVSWVDYNGDLVPRKELHPGESYMERSFASHPWVCTAIDWLDEEDNSSDTKLPLVKVSERSEC